MKLTDKERMLVSHARAGYWVDPAALAAIIDRLTAAPEPFGCRHGTFPSLHCMICHPMKEPKS